MLRLTHKRQMLAFCPSRAARVGGVRPELAGRSKGLGEERTEGRDSPGQGDVGRQA